MTVVRLAEGPMCRFHALGVEAAHGRYRLRCKRCGRTLLSPSPPDKTYALCQRRSRLGVLGEVVSWWRRGRPSRTRREVERLLEICRSCDRYDGTRCAVCGCVMSVKARMAGTKCPLGKW